MARTGMGNLIQRVRGLSKAGTADYTVGDDTYFSDDHIQDILDGNADLLIDSPFAWLPQTISGTVNYLTAQNQYRDFEEAVSGTARWAIRDNTGNLIGTANYSANYRAGRVTFGANQGGTAYYLTAYTYDVHAAAAEVWRMRLANFADWYAFSFKAGDTTEQFSRQQAFDHAEKMLAEMESRAGSNVIGSGGDIRVSEFMRTDVNVSYGDW